MQKDISDQASDGAAAAKAQAAERRAEQYRERFRRAQALAAQKARHEAAGGNPSDSEAARMVAEFIARGGRITVCPPAEEMPSGAGKDRRSSG